MDLLAQSPFINDVQNKLKLTHKIQIFFMSVTVAPVRLLCLFMCVFVASPLARLVLYKHDVRNKPLWASESWWRRFLYHPIRLFSRAVYFCGGLQWIRVYGTPDMSVPVMTCAPHFSFLDTLLFVYLNFPGAVGRAGSEEVPLFGPLVKMCQPIIVNRDRYSSRTDTVHRLLDRVKSNLGWPPTLLFVEGTTTNGTALIKFKPGAFIPALPVQPVCLRYICASSYDSITWGWKGPSVYKLVWLQLCQLHTTVEFHFLPVYRPSDEEKRDANLYAENVRQLMASYMKLPLSDYSYEDAKLMTKVAEHHLPAGVGLIKLQNLRKKYNIANFEDIFDLIPLYARVADKESGLCYASKFANNLGLVDSVKCDKLFELFDTDKKGNFTFDRFVNVYCQSMHEMFNNQNINTSIDQVLNSLEKFKNDNASNSSSSYSFEQLNTEFKQLFGLEFLSQDKLDLGNQRVLNKRALENHFRVNKLHLYLFTTVVASS